MLTYSSEAPAATTNPSAFCFITALQGDSSAPAAMRWSIHLLVGLVIAAMCSSPAAAFDAAHALHAADVMPRHSYPLAVRRRSRFIQGRLQSSFLQDQRRNRDCPAHPRVERGAGAVDRHLFIPKRSRCPIWVIRYRKPSLSAPSRRPTLAKLGGTLDATIGDQAAISDCDQRPAAIKSGTSTMKAVAKA